MNYLSLLTLGLSFSGRTVSQTARWLQEQWRKEMTRKSWNSKTLRESKTERKWSQIEYAASQKNYKEEPEKSATKRRMPQHKIVKTFLNCKPCKGADRALVIGGEGGGDLRTAGYCPCSLQCHPPMLKLKLEGKFICSSKYQPHEIVKG